MNPITLFSKSSEICAIAVGKTDGLNTHCGLLYNTEIENNINSFFLHLGNPLHLYNETEFDQEHPGYSTSKSNFIWQPFVDVPSQLLKLIRTKCAVIAKKNNALPYGVFHDEQTFFDAEGNLVLGQDSNGLTCASFVKVILKGSGLDVLDDTDWPDEREEDILWLERMIDHYKTARETLHKYGNGLKEKIRKSNNLGEIPLLKLEYTKTISKVTILNKTIEEFKEGTKSTLKRYKPEEISACSYLSSNSFPVKFEYAPGDAKYGAGYLGSELLKVLPPVNT